jgi:hypothetical protein
LVHGRIRWSARIGRLTESRAAVRVEMSGTCLSVCSLGQPFRCSGVSLMDDADDVAGQAMRPRNDVLRSSQVGRRDGVPASPE